jgi:YidC/Oxa1 family membrane protein insertase
VIGVWDSIREGLGWLLAFFYSIIPNTGVAIILLTVVVRLVLFPLTAKQAKSMIAMQRAQPEIKKLQAKYKNDRQKLNEEMMKFYKENQINPLGGCLPLLAQMPIFFALYQMLEDIQKFIPTSSQMFQTICKGAANAAECTANGKSPSLDFFGLDLTKTATSISGGFWDSLPYFILAGLVVISAYFQQRQTMRNQVNTNPQMQMIGKIMPLVFGMFAISMPAGVVLYFLTSNLWQIGQQEVVFRTITTAGPPKKDATVEAKSTDVTPPPAAGGVTGGVKGLFRSLSPSATAAEQETREPAKSSSKSPPAKSSGGAAGAGKSTSKATKKASTGARSPNAKKASAGTPSGSAKAAKPAATQAADQSKGGGPSPNARRKNNRKRKR